MSAHAKPRATYADLVVPDIAGWRRTKMPTPPKAAFVTLAPDWVCELLSESTEAIDRGEKMEIYAREGVGHAWLIDPLIQTLEVFRLDGSSWRMIRTWHGDVKVRAEPSRPSSSSSKRSGKARGSSRARERFGAQPRWIFHVTLARRRRMNGDPAQM